jgi:hypothetical protein
LMFLWLYRVINTRKGFLKFGMVAFGLPMCFFSAWLVREFGPGLQLGAIFLSFVLAYVWSTLMWHLAVKDRVERIERLRKQPGRKE